MEIGTGSPIIHGIGFGLIVWATSYLGWIPMLGILPPAPEDQPGRRRIMLLSPTSCTAWRSAAVTTERPRATVRSGAGDVRR
jgi:hypothetical protein